MLGPRFKQGINGIAVDPTWNQVNADATHIKLADGDAMQQARIVMLRVSSFSMLVEKRPMNLLASTLTFPTVEPLSILRLQRLTHVRVPLGAACLKHGARTQATGTSFDEQPLGTVYFGGGTLHLHCYSFFKAILQGISDRFNVLEDAEITIEVNPAPLPMEHCLRGEMQVSIA